MTAESATPRKAFFVGDPAIHVVAEREEKVEVALDRLLGTTADALERACESSVFGERQRVKLWTNHRRAVYLHRQFPSMRADSFQEAFEALTGKTFQEAKSLRVRESAVTTSDWANVLANVLNRRLLISYAEAEFFEGSLIRTGRATNYRTRRVVNIAEQADTPTVAEDGLYLDVGIPAETTLTYSMLKKGILLPLTIEVLTNNDVDVVTRHVDNAGRAARRTLAKAIWALWSGNATYGGDGVAWFHATHNNLQTAALAEAEVIAAIRKLLDQTRPGSGEKLALRAQPGSLWLTVPNALWDVAYKLNQTQGSALHHLFGERNENIIVNPLLSDVSDFGTHLDSSQIESIRVDYLNGREEPELAVADIPNAGALFTNDRIVYKLRHQYAIALADFRGAVKSQVA